MDAFAGPFSVFLHAEIRLKVGTVAPENSPWLDFWHKGVKAIESKLSGRIKILTYTSVPESEAVERFKRGEFEVVVVTSEGTFLLLPEFSVLSIPFLIPGDKEIDRVREKLFPMFQKIAESKGYRVLGWFDQGFAYILSLRPVSRVESFKGMKIGVWSSDPFIQIFFKELGAQPIYISDPSQMIEKLRSGELDGTYCSPLVCTVMQWYTVEKYLLDMRIRYEPAFIFTSIQRWDLLPENVREVIDEELQKRIPAVINLTRWYHASSIEGMVESGVQIIKPSPFLKEAMKGIRIEEDTSKFNFVSPEVISKIKSVLKE